MNILFLDVDGVLNNWPDRKEFGLHYICPAKVLVLATIIEKTKAKIILSSTWRLAKKNSDMVERALAQAGLRFEGSTEDLIWIKRKQSLTITRADEIIDWLKRNAAKSDKFAILDDTEEAGYGLEHSFFKTDDDIGLTTEIAQRVITHYGNCD